MSVAQPWKNEPDHAEFEHAGLPCIIHRNRMGGWCGYAGVSPGHPDHRKHYDDVGVEVHGGLTYADACQGAICHVPKPGQADDVWWFGFDCCHSGDLLPQMVELSKKFNELYCNPHTQEVYRDEAYVRAETCRLAEQLAARGQPAA